VWNYAFDLPSILIERKDGEDERYNVFTPRGELLYSINASDNQRWFYHFDEVGNTYFITNDNGEVEAAYLYSSYGEILVDSSGGSLSNPFTFQGKYGVLKEGESGLYYMRDRYYDSVTGRFISRDPVRTIDPASTNPYQYAACNPRMLIDPTGEEEGEITPTDYFVTNANTYAALVSAEAGRVYEPLADMAAKLPVNSPGRRELWERYKSADALNTVLQRVGEGAFALNAGMEIANMHEKPKKIKENRDKLIDETLKSFNNRYKNAYQLLKKKKITFEQFENMVREMNEGLQKEIQGISKGSWYDMCLTYTEGLLKSEANATPVPSQAWDYYFDWLSRK